MSIPDDLVSKLNISELRQAYLAARSLIADVLSQLAQSNVKVVYVSAVQARAAGISSSDSTQPHNIDPGSNEIRETEQTVSRSGDSDSASSGGNLSKRQIAKLQTLAMELAYIIQSQPNAEMDLSTVPMLYKKHFGCEMDCLGYSKLLQLVRAIASVSPQIKPIQRGTVHFLALASNQDSDSRQSKRPRNDVLYCTHFNRRSGCRYANSGQTCVYEHACDTCGDPGHGKFMCPFAT